MNKQEKFEYALKILENGTGDDLDWAIEYVESHSASHTRKQPMVTAGANN